MSALFSFYTLYQLQIFWFFIGVFFALFLVFPLFLRRGDRLRVLRERLESQQQIQHDFENRLEHTFQNLSSQALRENNQTFLEIAKSTLTHYQDSAKDELKHREEAIGTLVRPLQDSLVNVQKQVVAMEKSREGAYQGLITQVRSLSESQGKLETETAELVRALRTPSVRGRWGEVQLQRVVELAGMVEHCDFLTQVTTSSSAATVEGSSKRVFRPDMVVQLPGDKSIVVDAKAPVEAYLDAVQAKNDEEREKHLTRHVKHIKTHINQLSDKAYWKQFENTPEFVVLFLPGECFFSVAVEREPGLIEYGMERQIVVATPTTLIAVLRSVAYGWDQQKLTENAKEVRRLGRELFDRITTVGAHFENLRKGLVKSVDGYNKAIASLESRVFVSARKLGDLVSKEIDDDDLLKPIEVLPRAFGQQITKETTNEITNEIKKEVVKEIAVSTPSTVVSSPSSTASSIKE